MKPFRGFPTRMEFTPVPSPFFSRLLPEISDMAELKTTLHLMALIYRKKGYPRYVILTELLADASLMGSLKSEAVLRDALKMAAGRGTVIHMALEGGGAPEDVYFLNDEPGRQAVAKIQSGELVLAGLRARAQPAAEAEAPPDIFTLYEQNIGMLTPMIAEELREAEKLYPPDWIRDAIKEAVNQNKRKWSYISAILEHWSAEGKKDGAYQRDSKKTGPDKYFQGRYGRMVRH